MKKVIILLCLSFTFPTFGCATISAKNEQELIQKPTIADDLDNENFDSGTEDEEESKRKKQYLVSNVNGLSIRADATTNSAVYGYLDKNDALLIKGEKNNFYQTIYKEKTAFVSKNYCKLMEIDQENPEVENAIDLGSNLLGYPYVWGSQRLHWGNGKLNANYVHGEYDCSALVLYVYFKSNNVVLDVTSRAQSLNGTHVEKKDLKRGDLMFFTNASRKDKEGLEKIGHVGIYFGNNYILHTASDHAVIEPISNTRWSYYVSSRRVV